MSTTVSNPYSFNISKNTESSSSIQVILPNESQSLFSDSDTGLAGCVAVSIQKDIELKIPNGVNVIFVDANANATTKYPDSLNEGGISITNIENNKIWASQRDSITGHFFDLSVHKYIGVTPDKIYKLKINIWSFAEIDPGNTSVRLDIYYSALINQQNPDILDY